MVLSHVHVYIAAALVVSSALVDLNNVVTIYCPASFPKDFNEKVKTCGAAVVGVPARWDPRLKGKH